MNGLLKNKFNIVWLVLLFILFLALVVGRVTAQPERVRDKPIIIKVDSPPSDAPFGGFVATFDSSGKPIIKKFTDPNKMSQELGVSTEQVINPAAGTQGLDSTTGVSAVKTAQP